MRDNFDKKVEEDIRQWYQEQKTRFVLSDDDLDKIKAELDKSLENDDRQRRLGNWA